jgi:hypothetical protein
MEDSKHNYLPIMHYQDAFRIIGLPSGTTLDDLVCDWNVMQHHEIDGKEVKHD